MLAPGLHSLEAYYLQGVAQRGLAAKVEMNLERTYHQDGTILLV